MYAIDLTGQRFNRWTVLARAGSKPRGEAQWLCRCDCGNERVLTSTSVRTGHSKSCGCFKVEQNIVRSTKHGHAPAAKMSPTYSTWAAMVARCTNPKNQHYGYYGGRGIGVCEQWRDFANFLADMGEKPLNTSLDRIDGDLGYSPDNCRWATHKQQMNNTSHNLRVSFNGETLTAAEWGERLGLKPSIIVQRLAEGWSVEDALNKPPTGHRRFVTLNGETKLIGQWAKERRIPVATLYWRLNHGCTPEEALTPGRKPPRLVE